MRTARNVSFVILCLIVLLGTNRSTVYAEPGCFQGMQACLVADVGNCDDESECDEICAWCTWGYTGGEPWCAGDPYVPVGGNSYGQDHCCQCEGPPSPVS